MTLSHVMASISIDSIEFIVLGMIYILPSIISIIRQLKYKWLVIFTNILFGWIIVVWIACYAYTLCTSKSSKKTVLDPINKYALTPIPDHCEVNCSE